MIRNLNYYRPETVEEALHLLHDLEGETRILAGGTDLISNMKKNLINPDHVVDIKGIDELFRLEFSDAGLYIGAGVICNQLLESESVRKHYPLLVEAASNLASHQIRNRATVVGNLCNASPCADMAPALLMLGTRVIIRSLAGERVVALEEFFTGVKSTQLQADELVVGLQVSPPPAGSRGKYLIKGRVKGPDIDTLGVGGLLSREEKILRFAYSAVAPTPVLVDASELFFTGDLSFAERKEQLLEQVKSRISPITDVRSTREYRLQVALVYTERILDAVWEEGDRV